MQDVAAEAGMSPGNLYRYFPSKDALVAGLCERDRARPEPGIHRAAATPAAISSLPSVPLASSTSKTANAGKARLCLEIWAEATRNPAIAALQADFDRTLEEQLAAAFERAKAAGRVNPAVNARAVASIVGKLGDGLFVRRAVAADFDPDREVGEVFAVIEALLEGTIVFPAAADGQERQHDVEPHYSPCCLSLPRALWIGSGCSAHRRRRGRIRRAPAGPPSRRPASRLPCCRCARKCMCKTVTLSGRTEADNRASAVARTTGSIVSLKVRRGSQVKQGDVLAVLSDEAREAQVAEAAAMVAQAPDRPRHQARS